jgi:hypothetical protein
MCSTGFWVVKPFSSERAHLLGVTCATYASVLKMDAKCSPKRRALSELNNFITHKTVILHSHHPKVLRSNIFIASSCRPPTCTASHMQPSDLISTAQLVLLTKRRIRRMFLARFKLRIVESINTK